MARSVIVINCNRAGGRKVQSSRIGHPVFKVNRRKFLHFHLMKPIPWFCRDSIVSVFVLVKDNENVVSKIQKRRKKVQISCQ